MQLPLVGLSSASRAAEGAGSQAEAIELLQRIFNATKRLSYSGTFIYRQGEISETSRIARLVPASGVPEERIEALDGSPREIHRVNDEVRCYLPTTKTIKVEQIAADRTLLPIAPTRVADLAEHYEITKGAPERIAGYECQSIELKPRDKLRYGHRLWADPVTGMVLKAQTTDGASLIEQFVFTQLRIGPFPRRELESHLNTAQWKVERSGGVAADLSASGWSIEEMPAGFRKLAEMKRSFPANSEVGQIVLSDGLAAVSVFIERLREGVPTGASRQGAINVFSRRVNNEYLITAVGELPPAGVQAIAAALRYRGP